MLEGNQISVRLGEAVTSTYSLLKVHTDGTAKLTTGLCGADTGVFAVAMETGASGATILVRVLSGGVVKMRAHAASYAPGATLFTGAAGRVSTANISESKVGVLLGVPDGDGTYSAPAAQDDLVDVVPMVQSEDALDAS